MIRYLLLFLILSPISQARVFDLTKQSIGTYLRGTYAQSGLAKKAYEDSSGASTEFSNSVSTATSGEFGVYFGAQNIGFRISAELYQPDKMKDIKGKDSGGSDLMDLSSGVSVQIYKVGFEYSWFLSPMSKVYALVSVGQATVNLTNEYSNISGYAVSDFTEKSSESLVMGEIQLGYEYNFSADTTFLLDLGYRQLQAKSLKYSSSATTFLGNVSEGEAVLNSDGNNRTLDLGGLYLGFGFRFYINQ
ncbi:MAG: hypothetical protein VX642_13620 [Bdellovibrionota bacterium]|nr:hypothetical protein [Bdellovibrionota bacterium]